ncbi:lysophospholipid acyltransferase family protein [Sulfurospirillum sp. 1612]|uniref:lysophospholipid acyltransferase family protein n=1 Tax=Sulfurospirillum sp. 1612 TaxID=3094835 RepID=UPI002F92B749
MLSRIKALYIMIQFVITVLITIILMYLFRKSTYKIRQAWAKMQTFLIGFNIVQKGTIDTQADLIMVNHQSLLDITSLEAIYPKDLCWVAKKEIRDIPLFGHILVAPKMIIIDRKDRRSLVKLVKTAKERLKEGRIIAIFPEGTRGRGKKILKFQNGAKFLAEKLKLKVQPVVVVNTRNILDSQNFKAHSGTVIVKFLDLVDPESDPQWYENIKSTMQKELNDELSNFDGNR